MNIVHRVVIAGAICGAAATWFFLRGMPEITAGSLILYMVLPGASIALALYCVCLVFSCLGADIRQKGGDRV
jgi:hypothetical protein